MRPRSDAYRLRRGGYFGNYILDPVTCPSAGHSAVFGRIRGIAGSLSKKRIKKNFLKIFLDNITKIYYFNIILEINSFEIL